MTCSAPAVRKQAIPMNAKYSKYGHANEEKNSHAAIDNYTERRKDSCRTRHIRN